MPLTRVRDLVRHAAQHGYLVASFTVHGAEEVQAVVNGAEAARAPAIIAIDGHDTTLLRHDITLSIAESIAAAASVPIAVEVVSGLCGDGPVSARSDRVASGSCPPAANTASYAGAAPSGRVKESDRELWFVLPADAAQLAEAAHDGCRIGLVNGGSADADLRPAALRKQLQSLHARHQAALVADGDLAWSSGAFRSLPGLGVAKINFDKRLGQAMARANRKAALKAGDQYRIALKETFTALTQEVIDCLRGAGGSGRAADVIACAADDDGEPAPAASSASHSDYAARPAAAGAARRATPSAPARSGRREALTAHAG